MAKVSKEVKSICSVDIYPLKYTLDGLEGFRASIEEYFTNRKDVIQKVIKCEVVNFGNNVNLVTEVKVPRGWILFFGDPEENYADFFFEGSRPYHYSVACGQPKQEEIKFLNHLKLNLFL